jgi:lysophospholipase L1-like esterase
VRRGLTVITLLVLVAGCGDEGSRRPDGWPAGAGTRVAALGDSITAGSPRWDPAPEIRARLGPELDRESQYEHWAQRRLHGTRWRNCGVLGDRTDQIAGRLDDCARGADVLIVQGGINDIAQGRGVDAAARELREMVRHAKENGLRVALVELLPWNNGYPTADRDVRRLNELIGAIGRDERVAVYPWYRQLEDPARPGRMRDELTSDGSHPSVAGYRRLAEVVELP